MKSNIKVLIQLCFAGLLLVLSGCQESFLDEKPLDRFSPENLLSNKAGFESILVALHKNARDERTLDRPDQMGTGTDVSTSGVADGRFMKDYRLVLPNDQIVGYYWDWAYASMLKNANLIITRAENPEINWTAEEKNQVVAEARFFRAFTYNVLVNLFGGVPIVDQELTAPRFDFTRASRTEVLQFIQADLEFASQNLPLVGSDPTKDGRIFRAAALHLLSEVYISLGQATKDASFYDKAIAAATQVLDGSAGAYQLMTKRFGDTSRPGDAFSDLFWTNQQNRGSGNLETIWAVQYEFLTVGGAEGQNHDLRWWGPQFENIRSPDNKRILVSDSIGRSQGGNRPTNYFFYDIWKDNFKNDMRNSHHNIRRVWIYNDKTSEFFGQQARYTVANGRAVIARPDGTPTTIAVDTLRWFYPMIRKIEGQLPAPLSGRTNNDQVRMRLAETYLLRAEAHIHKGNMALAAADLNVVRSRANAKPVEAADVSLDYLLDERARELTVEEARRRTLVRLGKLYERATRYNWDAKATMQPYHELWPIPQKAIDANREAVLEQNPGYPGAK
ncbi:RagB/SusD family nutrient uptake outer membrane protein [Arundinibacter roseus]|uniref:RagB/SusD family nutrient uptake outer membrane protein n=1 Tax=Arundinibacter roseus TaxID=2070510 RepID=A0A4R4KIE4_9BACT|nr:RagB/SusD family nutrient uptake outer membrane protein [Arundinibacter roseus]TDB67950.1 RagB/SusD family nutrient uptake outer membrane protein [Arundinibacter roseus]